MTKLTFDIDFNKDPEEILREIQERAKAEVAKLESKEKNKLYLSNLHKRVNEDIGTKFASINDLIRALSSHANPKSRSSAPTQSPTGRRVTVSMDQEIFQEIKSKLAQPNPNKAAIARETGVSVVQVRKVAKGGYDKKFGSGSSQSLSAEQKTSSSPKSENDSSGSSLPAKETPLAKLPPVIETVQVDSKKPTLTPTKEEIETTAPLSPLPAPSLDLPPVPEAPAPAPEPPQPEPISAPEDTLLPPPSIGEEEADIPAPIAPPPAPSLDLPPVPEAPIPAPEPPQPEPISAPEDTLLPPPSLGEEEADIPAPIVPPSAPSLDLPPVPEAPIPAPEPPQPEPISAPEDTLLPPPSLGEEEADSPAPIAPPPAPSLDLPPVPEAPIPAPEPPQPEALTPPSPELPVPPSPDLGSLPPSPPSPQEPSVPQPTVAPPAPSPESAPPKPSLSLKKKPLSPGGKPGGTKFSLKTGKKKTTGLKITRPPMKPPSA